MYKGRISLTSAWDGMMKRRGKQKNWSERTRTTYTATLRRLCEFLQTQDRFIGKAEIYVDQLTEDHFADFMMLYNNKAHGYFDQVRSNLNVFCTWLQEEGYAAKNLVRQIDKRQDGMDDTVNVLEAYTEEEMIAIATVAGEGHVSRRYMVYFQAYSGRRKSEVTRGLFVGDVKLEKTNTHIMGCYRFQNKKAKHPTLQGLSPRLRDLIIEWLDIYLDLAIREGLLPQGTERLPDNWFLFPTTRVVGSAQKGEKRPLVIVPWSPISHPEKLVTQAARVVGCWRPWKSTHALRRLGGEEVLKASKDIRVVQTFLDHKDQRTTEHYIGRKPRDVALTAALALMGAVVAVEEPIIPTEVDPPTDDTPSNVISFASRRRVV